MCNQCDTRFPHPTPPSPPRAFAGGFITSFRRAIKSPREIGGRTYRRGRSDSSASEADSREGTFSLMFVRLRIVRERNGRISVRSSANGRLCPLENNIALRALASQQRVSVDERSIMREDIDMPVGP